MVERKLRTAPGRSVFRFLRRMPPRCAWLVSKSSLKKLTGVPPEVTAEQIAAQEKQLEGVRHEFNELRSILDRQLGALSQVGGAAARERLDRLTEALNRKHDEEQDRTSEYDAWKLLKDTLEQAEKSQSTHLGQALVQPLSQRLSALRQGKHQGLVLSPMLDLDKVHTGGGLQDWRRLSVGARDQVATLFRFALAEQLGSFLILDDQLAQSDAGRLKWFRPLLGDGACHKNRYERGPEVACRWEPGEKPVGKQGGGGDATEMDSEVSNRRTPPTPPSVSNRNDGQPANSTTAVQTAVRVRKAPPARCEQKRHHAK